MSSYKNLPNLLAQSLDFVKYSLQNLIIGEDILKFAFGEEYNRLAASTILSAWNNGDFSQIPTIQIIDGTILNGANAGYALANNTIYVSDYFLANSSGDRIAKVLTEEIGHYLDAQINTVDPVWDEGAVFAEMLIPPTPLNTDLNPPQPPLTKGGRIQSPPTPLNTDLNPPQPPLTKGGSLQSPPFQGGLGGFVQGGLGGINRKPEDDTATFYIDGVAIQIEQSIDVIGQWGGAFNGVQVVGNYAYIAKTSGLLILDISDPTKPIQLSNFYLASGSGDVEVVGDLAFVAAAGGGLVILDVSNPAAPSQLGSFDTTGFAFDVEVVGNTAFVADYDSGLVIVDVSNPAAPSQLGSFDTTENAYDVQVVGDRAFVADWDSGLVILDVSNPAAPSQLGSFDTTGNVQDVEVVGDQAFVTDDYGGLVILDVSNPAAPSRLGSFDTTGYAKDVEVVGNTAFVADYYGLVILDVSNPAAPSQLGSFDTSGAAYDVEVVGDQAFVADGSGLVILDVSNPAAPSQLGSFDTSGVALDVEVVGDQAFVADEYGGLVIIDVSNPAVPSRLGSFDTSGAAYDVEVVGNTAFVADYADYTGGLVIIDVSNPAAPSRLGSFDTTGYALDVEVVGDQAFVADYYGGLVIIDVSNPAAPSRLGSFDTTGSAQDVEVVGDQAFVADGDGGGLVIIDVSDYLIPVVPTLQFSQPTYQVRENGSLVGAAITVTRTGDLSNSSSVQVKITGGKGTAGVDYDSSGFPLTLDFAANQAQKTIKLPIIQDTLIEGTETVNFSLINPNNATIGSQTTAQLRIRDDDYFDITKEFIVAGGDPSSPDPEKNIADPNFRNVKFEIVSAWDDQLKKSYTPGKNVWIVSHGWNGNFNDFYNLGKTIAQAKPDDIVLALDWTQLAHTMFEGQTGLQLGDNFKAASWIRPLAEQIKETLKNWGLTDGTKLNLVGHSLGTLVSAELASLYVDNGNPTVNSITALDPPSETNKSINGNYWRGYDVDFRGDGYNDSEDRPKKFSDVAQFSRAFVGDPSLAGNEQFASWAHESFLVNFNKLTDTGASHGWVVEAFQNLIDPAKTDFKLANDLLNLDDNKKHNEFKQNAVNGKHEGRISFDEPSGNSAKDVTPNYLLTVQNNSLTAYGTSQADLIDDNQLDISFVSYLNVNFNFQGGKGNDTLDGSIANDTLDGGSGIDVLKGYVGDDLYIVDNTGDRVIDIITGGTDTINSSVSYTLPNNVENLTLIGTDNLTATGNNLANQLTGNSGHNELSGLNGNDLLSGLGGNDSLLGGAGKDTLTGGNGNDILLGGAGADTLTGGNGKDFFVYNLPTEGKDIITDFNPAQGDKIRIDRTGFGLENLAAGALQSDYFVLGTGAKDEGDRFIFNSGNNTLFFDSDGKGFLSERQKAIAILSNYIDLKASDIILV